MSDDGLFKFNINDTGGDIAVSKEYPVFRTRDLNSTFLLAKLNESLDFKNFALSQKAGGTRTRLYFSRLCEWRTLLPSFSEQQKIADCLASLDELITLEAQKLDTLKTHKKGLMQQLFPAAGGTLPILRFPEFRDTGGWIVTKLKDACDVNPGNSELPEKFAYIDLESVEAGELKVRKIMNRDEAPSRAQRLLRYGDVIFQIVRPYQRNNMHFKNDEGIPYVALILQPFFGHPLH